MHRAATTVLSVLMVGLGTAILVRSLVQGFGFSLGVLLGVLFVVAGFGRILVSRKGL